MQKTLQDKSKLSEYVVAGARLSCTLGASKSTLQMPISHGIFLKDKPQSNIQDRIPIKNIESFGSCTKIGPCIPATALPWVNKKDSTIMINGQKALIKDAVCFCTVGGIITIEDSGQG